MFVPSPAARTLALTALVGIPVVGLSYVGPLREEFSVLQPFVPISLPLAATVDSAVWWTLTVALCTVTSRILYGLRRDVRAARQLGAVCARGEAG